ncbi:MAG: BamA/TamA family outer membrane protein [Magnetococcales bacterium]|nr:BamA/TamA family outer membrane protein [Magnetococcales bacterium]
MMPFPARVLLSALMLFLPPFLSALAEEEDGSTPEGVEEPKAAYSFEIRGVDDREMLTAMDEASLLRTLAARPPASLAGIQRRAEKDQETLLSILQAHGFHAATVERLMNRDAKPVEVVFLVTPGPLYHLGEVRRLDKGHAESDSPWYELPPEKALQPGEPALTANLLQAMNRLPEGLRRTGFPRARLLSHQARLDHDLRLVSLDIFLESGPKARFGNLEITGLQTVQESHVRHLLPWREEELFDERRLQEFRHRLLETGLFRATHLEPNDTLDDQGRIPLHLHLEEAEQRTFGTGVRYASTLGLGASLFWEHRNLRGEGQNLRGELEGAQRSQSLSLSFVQPDLRDKRLTLTAKAGHENLEAYKKSAMETSAFLESDLPRSWKGRLGVSLEHAFLQDLGRLDDKSSRSTLLGLPLKLWHDTTDDRLDPLTGHRYTLTAIPYLGNHGGTTEFLRWQGEVTRYHPLGQRHNLTAAWRLSGGSIGGAPLVRIPADKRFFMGGGGTLRGYGYQLAGDLDEELDPTGGRSFLGAGVELRYRATPLLGIVPFLETGRSFENPLPDSTHLLTGAGLGLRYFTPVGPLRLDLAAPFTHRSEIDAPWQVHFSLGQAF